MENPIHRVPIKKVEENNQKQEILEEYLSYFSKHLAPPYTYDLPDHLLQLHDENYYHYMCRGNIIQALSGFMNLVVQDAEILGLNQEQQDRIKKMENSLLDLRGETMRTPEEMAFIKKCVEDMVHILETQKAKS